MSKRSVYAAVARASAFTAVPARAVDGRTVLLSGKPLAKHPPMRSACGAALFRLLERRPISQLQDDERLRARRAPSAPFGCSSSAGNTMLRGLSGKPGPNCPLQCAVQVIRPLYTCQNTGVVSITVNGVLGRRRAGVRVAAQ